VKARASNTVIGVSLLLGGLGCEEEPAPAAKPAASATVAQPAVTQAAPVASAAPLEDRDDCPEGSTGPGTFDKPCEGKGKTRMMQVSWTGKMTDTGPSFRVTNTSKLDIIYGKLAAYFYDKSGKQLEAVGSSESGDKKRPQQWCAGKIFDGPMKAGEKAVITFSCVKKSNVPEGTAFIEGELEMVGFPDQTGKTDFYWRNSDLTPDVRAKGANGKR
jgi:hypothetical protein